MRCLVTGAYGFIGREVVAALQGEGFTVIGAGRDLDFAARILPDIEWVACDFNRDVEVSLWVPRLKDIDAVVNCVGVLQGSLRDDADRIHADATIALFEACAAVSVRRIVHVSAVSAEAGVATDYARSKAKADAALGKLDANWLIVKPSLVIGRGSHGGTSLLRGLAGLPLVLPSPGEGKERFQPIGADDLARGIARLVGEEKPAQTTLYAAGPETVSVRDILVVYRAWLGFAKAREVVVPLKLLRVLLWFGDVGGLARPWLCGPEHLACADALRHAGRRGGIRASLRCPLEELQGDAASLSRDRAGPAPRQVRLRRPFAASYARPVLDADRHADAHAGKLCLRRLSRLWRGLRRGVCQSTRPDRLHRRHFCRRSVPLAALGAQGRGGAAYSEHGLSHRLERPCP